MSKKATREKWLEQQLRQQIDPHKLPRHVAIIMDGNGRWAKKRMLPRAIGHKVGIDSVRDVSTIASRMGIEVLTLYAFSTENWNRPKTEVDSLMRLLVEFLLGEIPVMQEENIRFRAMGRIRGLPRQVQQAVKQAEEQTSKSNRLLLNIAINYGGRPDIVDATKKIAAAIQRNDLSLEDISEEVFASYLYTSGLPDPDLLIRTGGEMRVSNFLLWQIAYAEIYITQSYWPEFRRRQFLEAVLDYQQRERRFGEVSKQVQLAAVEP